MDCHRGAMAADCGVQTAFLILDEVIKVVNRRGKHAPPRSFPILTVPVNAM